MIDWAASEFVAVITYLLPGFLAAWVFFGLTAHPRRDQFERLVQAVIFTGFVHAMTYGVEIVAKNLGAEFGSVGTWTRQVATCWSVVNALLIGLVFSVLANYGWLHFVLQKLRITKRTSYPSEWFSAFTRDKRWVVLHLDGKRRIYGWPEEWPDSADCGHFVLCHASWMLDDNEMVPIYAVDQLVIPVSSVELVERMKSPDEMTASAADVLAAEQKLASLYKKDDENEQQSSRSMPADNNGASQSNGQAISGECAASGTTRGAASAATTTPAAKKMTRSERKRMRRGEKRNQ